MIYLITLEPIETRYTAQWKTWFKSQFADSVEIDGDTLSATNATNFLNPTGTNIWKSEQIIKISKMFECGQVKENDSFFFYDAWHYGVIATKYMSELLKIPVKIFGIWHAGSYDPYDLLGTSFNYFGEFEKSLFACIDKSFVATEFHKNLIMGRHTVDASSIIVTGLPYDFEELLKFKTEVKENIIIFPHRLSDEKQPNIARDIEKEVSKVGWKVVFCQEQKLTKVEYHTLLAKSKIVFSASLQETWGIGTFEGLALDCIPFVPNRLSYKEMYNKKFLYPTELTLDWNKENKSKLLDLLQNLMYNYDQHKERMKENFEFLKKHYCTFKHIVKEIQC